MKRITTVYLDEELWRKAKESHINLSKFLETELALELSPNLQVIELEQQKAELEKRIKPFQIAVLTEKEEQQRHAAELAHLQKLKEVELQLEGEWEGCKLKNRELANMVYCATRDAKGIGVAEYRIKVFNQAETDEKIKADLLKQAQENGYEQPRN